MKRSLLILLLLSSLKSAAFAQSALTGRVRDETGQPLARATVLLLTTRDSVLVKGALSAESGVFGFENLRPGTYRVSVSTLGYRRVYSAPFALEAASGTYQLPPLTTAAEARQLADVTVTAQKPLFEQQMDKLIVNVQSSITAAGSSALDVLERAPGVTVNRQNGSLALAGKSGVLVLIDGKLNRLPMDALVQLLSGMNASNLEKIELIANPSARYDAEGDAGVINLVLKKNTALGTNGTATLGLGLGRRGFLKPQGSLALNHRRERLNLFGDYTLSDDPAIVTLDIDRLVRYQGRSTRTEIERPVTQRRTTHNARLGFDLSLGSRTQVGGLLAGFSNRLRVDALNQTNLTQNGVLTQRIAMQDDEINHWQHALANLNLRHTFANKSSLSLDADYLRYHNQNPHDYDTRYEYLTEARQNREGITIRKNTPIGMLVLKGDYAGTWKKNSLEFGAKTTRMRLTNDVTVQRNLDGTWKPDPEFSQNYFLEDAIDAAYFNLHRPLGKGKLQAGLRYEHTSTDIGSPGSGAGLVRRRYGSWFPSLFWALDFSKKSGIQLAYSRRIQRPDYALLAPFVFFSDPNTFITGNATLLPTFSDAVQGTYRFHENYLLTLRYSHDRDALDRFRVRVDSATNRSFITPQNIRSLNTLALTLAFPVRVTPWWQIQTNLLGVYQRADASVEGQALVFAQANANLSSTHTFKLPRDFSAELTAFYQSPALNGISRRLAFGALGLGVQKKLPRNRGTLRLSLSDAFRTNFMRIVSDNPAVNQVANWTLRFDSRVLRLTFTRSLGSQSVKAATRRATGSEDERGRVSTN